MPGCGEGLFDRRNARLQGPEKFALHDSASMSQEPRAFTFDKECYVTVVRRAVPV